MVTFTIFKQSVEWTKRVSSTIEKSALFVYPVFQRVLFVYPVIGLSLGKLGYKFV